jgi:hypothetical protein
MGIGITDFNFDSDIDIDILDNQGNTNIDNDAYQYTRDSENELFEEDKEVEEIVPDYESLMEFKPTLAAGLHEARQEIFTMNNERESCSWPPLTDQQNNAERNNILGASTKTKNIKSQERVHLYSNDENISIEQEKLRRISCYYKRGKKHISSYYKRGMKKKHGENKQYSGNSCYLLL